MEKSWITVRYDGSKVDLTATGSKTVEDENGESHVVTHTADLTPDPSLATALQAVLDAAAPELKRHVNRSAMRHLVGVNDRADLAGVTKMKLTGSLAKTGEVGHG